MYEKEENELPWTKEDYEGNAFFGSQFAKKFQDETKYQEKFLGLRIAVSVSSSGKPTCVFISYQQKDGKSWAHPISFMQNKRTFQKEFKQAFNIAYKKFKKEQAETK